MITQYVCVFWWEWKCDFKLAYAYATESEVIQEVDVNVDAITKDIVLANITDEEKQRKMEAACRSEGQYLNLEEFQETFTLTNRWVFLNLVYPKNSHYKWRIANIGFRPYLEAIFNAFECSENDYAALFALCLLYALGHNEGNAYQ